MSDLKRELKSVGAHLPERRVPHLLYWLGHSRDNCLTLGGTAITPRQLRNMFNGLDYLPEMGAMLTILNACRTTDATADGSFLEVLHSSGLPGAIATEVSTFSHFANDFGLKLSRVP